MNTPKSSAFSYEEFKKDCAIIRSELDLALNNWGCVDMISLEQSVKYVLCTGRAYPNRESAELIKSAAELFDNWILRLEAAHIFLYCLPWHGRAAIPVSEEIGYYFSARNRFALTDLPMKINERYSRRLGLIEVGINSSNRLGFLHKQFIRQLIRSGNLLPSHGRKSIRSSYSRLEKELKDRYYSAVTRSNSGSSIGTNLFNNNELSVGDLYIRTNKILARIARC
jgi:hypothetical protein